MTLSAATFLERHPEFASINETNPAMVTGAIADAIAEVDATACGAETDKVVRLKAADALARSPFGQQAQLVNDEGQTPYQASLEKTIERIGHGYRVEPT